jgi:hypothetical protein
MGRTASRPKESPLPPTQKIELMPPAITGNNRTSAMQQKTPLPVTQWVEPKQSTVTEDDVRLRAYEIYLQRGAIPGDEVSDWLQAERELLAN